VDRIESKIQTSHRIFFGVAPGPKSKRNCSAFFVDRRKMMLPFSNGYRGRVGHPWFEVTSPANIGAKADHATPSVDGKGH